jgi:hypothetical protein
MRIIVACVGCVLLLVCSGCANSGARASSGAQGYSYAAEAGGVGERSLGGQVQGDSTAIGASRDYYEVLSDPGLF